MPTRPFITLLLLAGLALAQTEPPAKAAAPVGERLAALVAELRALGDQAWQQRAAELEQKATELERSAATAAEQARAVRAELKLLQDLRQLLGIGGAPAPDGKGAPATASPAPAPKDGKAGTPAPAEPAKTGGKTETPAAPLPTPPTPAKTGQSEPPAAPPPKAAHEGKSESLAAAAAAPAKGGKDGKPEPTADALLHWGDVEPLFAAHCTACHDPDSKKGGLDLTSLAAALQGGGSGRSLVPGEPDQSRLLRLISGQERPFMPRDADPLPATAVARVRRWIEQGAAEDPAAARSFVQAREAAAKVAAAADATMAAPIAEPLPTALPAVAVNAPARPVPIAALARSPRAPLLALPGCQQVLLFATDLRPLGVLPCALDRVATVAFSADGAWLVAGGGAAGRSGTALVYDVVDGHAIGAAGSERDVPLAVAVHRGRGLCALGGAGKHARVHALQGGKLLLEGRHDDFVLGLDFSPDGKLLAAADRKGNVVLWEVDTGQRAQTLEGHKGAVQAVQFHKSGSWLCSAGADGTLRAWDTQSGKERWRQNAHQGEAVAVAIGPGDAVASCGSDGRIAVFTAAGKPVASSPPVGDWLCGVAFGADDQVVFAGDMLGRLHRFEVGSKQMSASVPLPPATSGTAPAR